MYLPKTKDMFLRWARRRTSIGAKYPVVPKTRAEIKPLSFSGLILANPKSDTRILVYLKSRCMTDGMEVIVERERNDHVTAVKADTLKLIVQILKTPKLSSPFPDECEHPKR
ncbi:hypothetical protein Tco_1313359 [Tanacetum coccineum]